MGKMLAALKQSELKHGLPAEGRPALRSYQPEPSVEREAEPDENIPFIEVGGPRATTEASPTVLAGAARAPAKTMGQLQPERGPRLQPLRPPAAPPARSEALTAVFRPLPLEPPIPAPARIAPELIAYHQPDHQASSQYRALHAVLAAHLPAARPQVLLFTAAAPEVGTTTVLLNVAIVSAQQGKLRVAVVDANLRRPAVAERLGLSEAPGLREVLTGVVRLSQALQETGQANLYALTAGRPNFAWADSMRRPKTFADGIRSVLSQLREGYSLVLVDAPWWDGQPELIALGSACDAVFLVLPQAQAATSDTMNLMTGIPKQGSRLCGCILTQR